MGHFFRWCDWRPTLNVWLHKGGRKYVYGLRTFRFERHECRARTVVVVDLSPLVECLLAIVGQEVREAKSPRPRQNPWYHRQFLNEGGASLPLKWVCDPFASPVPSKSTYGSFHSYPEYVDPHPPASCLLLKLGELCAFAVSLGRLRLPV